MLRGFERRDAEMYFGCAERPAHLEGRILPQGTLGRRGEVGPYDPAGPGGRTGSTYVPDVPAFLPLAGQGSVV